MKKLGIAFLSFALASTMGSALYADTSARVTETFNIVDHGPQGSTDYSPADKGTLIPDGEDVKTGPESHAELKLPSTSVTRLGANTIFNYSADSNTVDLQSGTILFCKPKESDQRLNIKTAAVTAAIVGTTGFASVTGEGNHKTYILGLIEGHAIAHANDHPFPLGPGDALEFAPGRQPFIFAYDVPRFVHSAPLLTKFHTTLPNQAYIDKELAEYADDASRGFIEPPHKDISYSGNVPLIPVSALDSAQNAQDRGRDTDIPPAQPQSSSGGYQGGSSSYH